MPPAVFDLYPSTPIAGYLAVRKDHLELSADV